MEIKWGDWAVVSPWQSSSLYGYTKTKLGWYDEVDQRDKRATTNISYFAIKEASPE